MSRTKHRTQLFLESEQYRAVASIAEAQHRTISDVVREFVDLGLQQNRADFRRRIQEAAALRRELEAKYGVFEGDPVAEVRKEWEGRLNSLLDPGPP